MECFVERVSFYLSSLSLDSSFEIFIHFLVNRCYRCYRCAIEFTYKICVFVQIIRSKLDQRRGKKVEKS